MKFILGGRGPNKHPGPNDEGFYEDTNERCVLSTIDLFSKRKHWLKKQARPYRLRPCYRNVEDPESVEWWLIHSVK